MLGFQSKVKLAPGTARMAVTMSCQYPTNCGAYPPAYQSYPCGTLNSQPRRRIAFRCPLLTRFRAICEK